jgi:flagellar basal-body rod protein FlgB
VEQNLNVFAAITRRLDWLSQRQRVLAQNIANADTPNYLPHDLKEGPFSKLLARRLKPAVPVTTHPNHIEALRARRGAREKEVKDTYESAPAGNAVVLEEQMVKVAENQMSYQTMTNLYRKHLQMLRTALGSKG